MKIDYDKESDAMYIEIRKGKFSRNKKVDDITILDLDKEGNILGIELLDVSKRAPSESLKKLYVKNMQVVAQ